MSKHQLTRGHVLRASEEIGLVLRQKPQLSQHFSFHTHKSVEASHESIGTNSRLGLAIPKKLSKRAIDRNRIKRLIREHFRRTPLDKPRDIVVKLKMAIGKKTRNKLREKERQEIRSEISKYFHD
jgi:ribonuclease P protein component